MRSDYVSLIRMMLYGTAKTTLLHSLEVFVGKIDFNKIHHYLSCGSMMASPLSTAAYLMNFSNGNAEAEAYLRDTILNGGGSASGGVQSVFPCTIFELTWVCGDISGSVLDNKLMKWQGHLHASSRRFLNRASRRAECFCYCIVSGKAFSVSKRAPWF